MRRRPILFNTDMVRAILASRKTVTRRILKLPKYLIEKQDNGLYTLFTEGTSYENQHLEEIVDYIKKPYKPLDILYVRETWRVGAWDIRNQMIAFDYKDGTCGQLTYISDRDLFERLVNQSREDARKAKCEYNGVDFVWKKGNSPCRWHPSIHMPKEAARIWLKVKDVRVERLQDITEEQAYHEGIMKGHDDYSERDYWYYKEKQDYLTGEVWTDSARQCFLWGLWDSTLKKSDLGLYDFNANPWVWVIEFERCEKQEIED